MQLTLEFEIQFLRNSQLSNSFVLHLMKIFFFNDHVKNATTKISNYVGVMRRLHW